MPNSKNPVQVKSNVKGGVTLKKIATELKMDRKNARARLRRMKIPADMLVSKEHWEFTEAGAKFVKKELKTDHRKVG